MKAYTKKIPFMVLINHIFLLLCVIKKLFENNEKKQKGEQNDENNLIFNKPEDDLKVVTTKDNILLLVTLTFDCAYNVSLMIDQKHFEDKTESVISQYYKFLDVLILLIFFQCSKKINLDKQDEYYLQSTTNEEFYRENNIDTKYKKWLNSDTDISRISSIYRLELENSNGIKSENLNENQKKTKINENENGQEKKESEEGNIEEQITEKEIKETKSEENNSEETFEDSNKFKKNYTFLWDEGGNDVKITGSFSDWKIKFQMTKDPNNQIFKCILPLGNEIYQYKFIVDGEWKFSKKFPTKDDGNGNINNIIDNTKNILVQPKEKNKEETKLVKKEKTKKIKKKEKTKKNRKNKQSLISTKTKTTKTRASTVNKDKIIRKNSIYQSEYPSDDDILPLPLPNEPYFESFELENYTNQKKIGKKNYYEYYDRYCFFI